MLLWVVRVLWLLVPVTVGSMLDNATLSWSSGSVVILTILVFALWMVGLLALSIPSDRSFTALRIVAALPLIAVVLCARSSTILLVVCCAIQAVACMVIALGQAMADKCAQRQAYGSELRRPLRTPPFLCFVTSVAVIVVAFGFLAGPLLIGDEQPVLGVIATIIGFAIAAILVRAIHSLSKRFYVFVPAGLVISDPLTLSDPVLLPSERIDGFTSFDGSLNTDPSSTVDTRSGANAGCIAIHLTEPGSFARRSGRDEITMADASTILFTPLRPKEFLQLASPPTANPLLQPH